MTGIGDIPRSVVPVTTKAVLLVDGANIEISAKERGLKSINYGKLTEVILSELKKVLHDEDITLIRPYYYDSYDGSQEKRSYLEKLENLGYDLQGVISQGHPEAGIQQQKCVDIKIAVDMVHFAHATPVELIILCSGDMDFKPAVEIVKYTLKKVVIVSFKHSTSEDLMRKADLFIDLTPMISRLKSGGRRKKRK